MGSSCCYCNNEHPGTECPLLVSVREKYGIDKLDSAQRKAISDRILKLVIDGLYEKKV